MTERSRFVIAGAGIGGLAVPLALARAGRGSIVVERAAELREVGAGLQLAPNAFYAFQQLGIVAEVDRMAFRPHNQVMMDSVTGEEIARVVLGIPLQTGLAFHTLWPTGLTSMTSF